MSGNDFGGAPTVNVGKALNGGSWFSDGAAVACPAPVTADLAMFGTFEITFDWLCRAAKLIKPFVVAFAYLTALFIITRRGE